MSTCRATVSSFFFKIFRTGSLIYAAKLLHVSTSEVEILIVHSLRTVQQQMKLISELEGLQRGASSLPVRSTLDPADPAFRGALKYTCHNSCFHCIDLLLV
jgi:hypothetical protein